MNPIWLDGLRRRLDEIYARLAAGEDVPLALHLGTEGYAAAGIEMALCDHAALAALVEECHRTHLGQSVQDRTGLSALEWITETQTPCLPVEQRRAPVYPSRSS